MKSYFPKLTLGVLMLSFFSLSVGQAQTNPTETILSSVQESLNSIISQLRILQKEQDLLQEELDQANRKKNSQQRVDSVLIVAGHTARSPGTTFGSTTEYMLNYEVMQRVGKLLSEDNRYNHTLSHKGDDYNQTLLDYFSANEARIIAFKDQKKREYVREYPLGLTTNDTDHNHATPRGIIELYGVNKWLSEQGIDLAVHVHFNDYPGRLQNAAGYHEGFSIFIPPKTNDHFVESYRFAKLLESEMLKHSMRSTVARESTGILESELIATGHRNTVNIPSVLLEGGFIYEEKLNDSRRDQSLDEVARSIYRAIVRYDTNR